MTSRFDFAGVFDEDYLYFYAALLGDERSDAETDVIAGLLGLEAGMRVLDAPCGHGRIANRLAARGADVVGLDSNRLFLEQARRDAAAHGLDVDYVEGDLRNLPWLGSPEQGRSGVAGFDAVVNWFTSFGYFDDETDRRLLVAFRRVLKPDGHLLVELVNRDRLVRTRVPGARAPTFVVERGDDLMIDRVELDLPATRAHTERIVVRAGRVRRTAFSLRLFTFAELSGWLEDAGFRAVEPYASDGTPFSWDVDRLVVLASA